MKRWYRFLALALAAVGLASARAGAWHGKGHHVATTLAVEAVGGKLPAFFGAGAAGVAHCSLDPDLFTRPIAPEPLHSAEASEHYFDVELLAGTCRLEDLPATRYEYIELCARHGLKPNKIGLLPYAVAEWTQRLTVAFAEHRAYPDNPHVRGKCLVYAGILAHYAQDLCQPLHVTVHWDGRAKPDGSSPRSGIHAKVDALLGKLHVDRRGVLGGIKIAALDKLAPGVLAEIRRSHALVEAVYAMEKQVPAMTDPLPPDSDVGRFAAERLRACVRFTASLYLTAWRDSAAIKAKLPKWYHRPYDPPPKQRAASPPAAAEAKRRP